MFHSKKALEKLKMKSDLEISKFVQIDDKSNSITFIIQNGNIPDNGINGIQVYELILFCYLLLNSLNEKVRSSFNMRALECLSHALAYLDARKLDREERGVEGTNND